MHKNEFQDASKKYNNDIFQNNFKHPLSYTPNYISKVPTNSKFLPYKYDNQLQIYSFPENAFTINNKTNYFFTNNITIFKQKKFLVHN